MSAGIVWECDDSEHIAICRSDPPKMKLEATHTVADFSLEPEYLDWMHWKMGRLGVTAAFDPHEATLYVVGKRTPARAAVAEAIRGDLIEAQRRATMRVVR